MHEVGKGSPGYRDWGWVAAGSGHRRKTLKAVLKVLSPTERAGTCESSSELWRGSWLLWLSWSELCDFGQVPSHTQALVFSREMRQGAVRN